MDQYPSRNRPSLGDKWERTASGWRSRLDTCKDAGDSRSDASSPPVDEGIQKYSTRRGEFARRTFEHFTESGRVEGQIRVHIPNDRPFLYLDTSLMRLLYGPLIPDGNTSTQFILNNITVTTEGVSFYLESLIVQDAKGKVSAEPLRLKEYDFTFQVGNDPSLLVAIRSATNPNLYALYTSITEGGQTQGAYLLPNTKNLQKPRKRTITAHVDPDPTTDLFVFEQDFRLLPLCTIS